MTALPPEPSRVPALDGIRGLAIALVMPFHFVSQYASTQPLSVFGEAMRVGWAGVDLFFVLSGFLITGILVEQRGALRYYRAFYWRRVLRILPAFMVLMTVLWLIVLLVPTLDPVGAQRFRQWQPWYWTFTVNWLALGIGGAAALPYGTGLLWSLSVEENFYFVWPALVALLAPRALPRALWGFVAGALITRVALLAWGDTTHAAYTLTPSRLDSLAAGALLAVAWRTPSQRARLTSAIARLANAPAVVWLIVAAIVYGILRALDHDGFPNAVPMLAVGFTFTAAVGTLLIACALVANESSALGRFCVNPIMRTLGRYAYALYLFHVLVALAFKLSGFTVPRLATWTGSVLMAELAFTLVVGAASVGLAALSWKAVERPMLQLKDAVPYGTPGQGGARRGARDPASPDSPTTPSPETPVRPSFP